MSALRLGVVGLGFMGQTHLTALGSAQEAGLACRLTAVCDRDPERRSGNSTSVGNLDTGSADRLFDPAEIVGFENADELFSSGVVDAVSICTHTDTHVELACRALDSGLHVLIEKPVALDPGEIDRIRAAAESSGRVCMPAMVMRFWPGWRWLKETIDKGAYGAVEVATFRRLGAAPAWAAGFYDNPELSGGALVDLHIHDTDFVRWCFGDPSAVSTHGSLDHSTTVYHYEGGPSLVAAEGGWIRHPAYPFQMQYEVVFERAVARFDITREIPLEVVEGDRCTPIEIDAPDGYAGEMHHFIEVATAGGIPDATLDDASAVARLLIAERDSLESGERRPV